MFFVSGNLKTAVGRGVADGTSGLQVLFAQFLNDDGAGSRFVAEDAVEFGVTAYLFDQFLRKDGQSGLKCPQPCKFGRPAISQCPETVSLSRLISFIWP